MQKYSNYTDFLIDTGSQQCSPIFKRVHKGAKNDSYLRHVCLSDPDGAQMSIWRMNIASQVLKATNVHSEYVVLFAFPLLLSVELYVHCVVLFGCKIFTQYLHSPPSVLLHLINHLLWCNQQGNIINKNNVNAGCVTVICISDDQQHLHILL